MKNPDITIRIRGRVAIGKTCLAHKLASLLQGEGHTVGISDGGRGCIDANPHPATALRFREPRRIKIVIAKS